MRQIHLITFSFVFAIVIILLVLRETVDEKILRKAKEKPFLPPYHQINRDYFTAYQYNITTCSIRKSMSQMVFNTMCLLHDPDSFLNGNHNLSETWKSSRACKYEDVDGFGQFPETFKNSSDFTRIVFIRDPFDRFLSMYLDKCVRENFCFKCNDDMRCVVQNIYESLTNDTLRNVQYGASFIDKHSAPTSWYCDFDKYLKAYHVFIIGPEIKDRQNAIMKLSNILERKKVPEKLILKIVKETLSGETSHGTHKSDRRKIAKEQMKNDPIVREYLHKIYLNDYLVFPFDRSPLDPQYQTGNWDEIFKEKYSDFGRIQDLYANLLN